MGSTAPSSDLDDLNVALGNEVRAPSHSSICALIQPLVFGHCLLDKKKGLLTIGGVVFY